MRTLMPAKTPADLGAYWPTHAHTHASGTCRHTSSCIPIHKPAYVSTHIESVRTYGYARVHTHAYTHVLPHAHAHIYAYTYTPALVAAWPTHTTAHMPTHISMHTRIHLYAGIYLCL